MTYDAIVLGLGGMGSATAAELARRGVRVLGLEQFGFVHSRGSSHGRTRIIRTAYYEHPAYVPLVRRAFDLWRELEQRTGKSLLTPSACLCVGEPGSELITGVRASAAEHALPVETLTAAELRSRYPQFRLPEHYVGVLEQSAGILAVEDCVRAHLDDATAHGAELRAEEPALAVKRVGDAVEVQTASGTYSAAKLVVTAGAWATKLLADIGVPLSVMRQVQLWFDPGPAAPEFALGRFPIFMIETPGGAYYGMPSLDAAGVKCARHYGQPELPSPDGVNWVVSTEDETPVRQMLAANIPGAVGPLSCAEVCMYTLTPDRHFVIDRHPAHPQVSVACGFSGHGFKFSPVVGEILADLALTGTTSHPIGLFRATRFSS